MPDKIKTETQFTRLLSVTPYPVEMRMYRLDNHVSKNCCPIHIEKFYQSFDEEAARELDALIITGAPLEHLKLSDVTYWKRLQSVMDLAAKVIPETLGICWSGMALVFHHHGIEPILKSSKIFGCIEHTIIDTVSPLVFGVEEGCKIPVSRWTTIPQSEVEKQKSLKIVMTGSIGGICMIRDYRNGYTSFLNHLEYDSDTLAKEYKRDRAKGIDIEVPINYFPNDNPNMLASNVWFNNARTFYSNWLNLVYSRKGLYEQNYDALSIFDEAMVHSKRTPTPC